MHPGVQDVIDKYVEQLVEDDVVERRLSQWGNPVTSVTYPDGSPRYHVDHRNTINTHLGTEIWPMPDIIPRIDAVQVSVFISALDIQQA